MAKSRASTPLDRIREVERATEEGRALRERLRRRSNKRNVTRVAALDAAIRRINEAQAELRRDLGRMNWNVALERSYGDRARAGSSAAQAERRKLRKMLV